MITDELIARVERLKATNRDIDWDIAEAFGGAVRRVSRLGLGGRAPGSYRVFWPGKEHNLKGSAIPYYTKTPESRARIVAKLRALKETDHGTR
jgi:hypothetical protein